MKFEKFLKNVGVYGAIVNCGEYGKFLQSENVMLRIPDGANVIAAFERAVKDWENDVFTMYGDGDKYEADLTAATLPTPDAKPSQIQRIFSDQDGGQIAIDNKTFSFVERMDGVFMTFDTDEVTPTALVITEGYGDNETLAGVIFAEEYYAKHMEI